MVSKIERLTKDIEDMRTDILSWSFGINKPGGNFWQRNKTRIISLALFGGMTLLAWIAGWNSLYRISGLFLILQLVSNIFNIIKWLWKKFWNR